MKSTLFWSTGMRRLLAAVAISFAFALPARAASVVFYVDLIKGTDFVTPALADGGHTVTVATSWTDFNAKLSAGGVSTYQLAIGLNQNNANGADLAIVQTYINAGGRVIFADWTRTV